MANLETFESISFQLGQLNAKMDESLKRSDEDRRAAAKIVTRVEALERWKWTLVGASAGSGGLVSYLMNGMGM